MFHTAFCRPDVTTLLGLGDLDLEATGLHVSAERAVIECVPTGEDGWWRRCVGEGVRHGFVDRWLVHVPLAGAPRCWWFACPAIAAAVAAAFGVISWNGPLRPGPG